MLRGYLLRYLAAVSSQANSERAAALLPIIVRSLVLAQARQVVSKCGLETELAADESHVHRLAYLAVLGREAPNANDAADVSAWFAAHRDLHAESRAWLRTAFGLVAIALIGLAATSAAAYLRTAQTSASASAEAVASTATDTNAITGEAAAKASALEGFFRDAFPGWVVALDAESVNPERATPEVARHHSALIAALEHEQPALVKPLAKLLDVAENYSRRKSGEEGENEIRKALSEVNDALGSSPDRFYVDAIILRSTIDDRRRLLVSTYKVRRSQHFASGAQRLEALDLVRLDNLNFEQSLLGYTRPDVKYALVLTDRVEGFLIKQALPTVYSVDESSIVRDYHTETGTEWVTPLETALQEDLHTEARQVIPEESLQKLAAAVARRQRAVAVMSGELHGANIELRPPARYAYDPSPLERFASHVRPETLAEVRRAQQALADTGLRAAYDKWEDACLSSIARHEAQHRLDFEQGRLQGLPAALVDYTGSAAPDGKVAPFAERINAELSAYLSQVAREPKRARTNLIYILAFVMDRHAWGIAESYAALALFEQLAQQLELAHGPFVVQHQIVRKEVAGVYMAARARSGDELANAARKAWQSLYGAELPPLEVAR